MPIRSVLLAILSLVCASAILAQPSINAGGVLNVSGYQATLAPGVIFVIFGSGMGPASIATASVPYPSTLSGTQVTFTPASGSAVTAKIVYSVAGQVAGELPSSTAPGTYAVRVIYNSQMSAPQTVTVAARSFGIATSNSAGNGTAQATIANVNGGLSLTRFTSGTTAFGGYNWTLTPAHPGDTLVFWGTGGGADVANDAGGTSGDQTAAGNFVVNVGGTPITPLYAGASSGYPGLWQINFTLPANITPNCFALTTVTAGGQTSNAVTIPIAATGQTACSAAGFTTSTLSTLDAGGNVTFSGLTLGKLTEYLVGPPTELDEAGGPISQYSAAEWLRPFSGPQVGGCSVLDETYAAGGKEPSAPNSYLNAGASLAVTGASSVTLLPTNTANGPVYLASPGGSLVAGGTYTVTGTGGSQVGAFTATTTIPASFTVSNFASITNINRSQPLTFSWTGSGFDSVQILLQSGLLTSASTHTVNVGCFVPAAPGSFTVPTAALAYLLPTGSTGSVGQLVLTTANANGGTATPVSSSGLNATIPLVAGGQVQFGGFGGFLGVISTVTIQ